MGYAAGLEAPVTLLIGDMATLHDLGSLHALTAQRTGGTQAEEDTWASPKTPITIVCVNNGGKMVAFLVAFFFHRHSSSDVSRSR